MSTQAVKQNPKSKTKWTTAELSPDQRRQYDAFARDWLAFIQATFHVEARDRAGKVILLKLRSEQAALWDTIQTVRAINLYVTARQAGCLGKLIRAARLSVSERDIPSRIVSAIKEAKPEAVFLDAEAAGLEVSDGPVFINTVKARRVGFSTLIRAFIAAFHTFRFPTKGMTLSLDAPSSENVLKIDKMAFDYMDENYHWLVPPMENERDTLRGYANGSEHMARTSDGKAPRGFQIPILHATEVAHYVNGKQYAAALVATPPDFYCFEESTGNGPGGVFFEHFSDGMYVSEALEALDRNADIPRKVWYKHFSPWHKDPAYAIPFRDEASRTEFLTILDPLEESYIARGATAENLRWRREMIATVCKGDPDLSPEQFFMQEYPFDQEEAFQKASSEVFPAEQLARHAAIAAKKRKIHYLYHDIVAPITPTALEAVGNIHIAEPPDPEADYLMSIDSSKAVGKDQTILDIYRREPSGKIVQVAQFASNKVGDVLVGHLAVTLAEWYNGAFVVPEVNESSAGAIISTIVNVCGYFNLMRRIPNGNIAASGNSSTFNFGFYTTKQSKEQAIGELKQYVADGLIEFSITQTLDEMRTFGRDPDDNGLRGLHGKKDDRVMAAAIAVWASQPLRGAPMVRRLRASPEKILQELEATHVDPQVRAEQILAEHVERMESREAAARDRASGLDSRRFPVTMRKVR